MTEQKKTQVEKVKMGDVWAIGFRRTTIVGIRKYTNGRMRIRYKGNTGAELEAWADVYLRNRTLVERDGQKVSQ